MKLKLSVGSIVGLAIAGLGLVVACSSDSTTPTPTPDSGVNCGDGSQMCGTSCTAIARDAENCGACGKKCGAGEVCSQGACATSCGGGTTKCGTACADTKSDGSNCGACGTKCAGGEVCSAGKCTTTCGASTTQCGNSCVNTKTDQVNCGACGTLCAGGEQCVGGKCTLSCQVGLTLCSTPVSDGGVADAASDGNVADSSSDAANDVGVSDAASDVGVSDAASDVGVSDAASDGGPVLGPNYCANLQTDDGNCGGCGIKCGNSQQCQNGVCTTTCAPPNTLCAQDGGPSTCNNLKADPNSCGTCGKVCAGGANATAVCLNGGCGLACKIGFADANNNPADGCELQLFPAACSGDKDVTGSNYVVCAINSTGAWISANNNGGGCTYGALNICKKYGFTKVARWGGTCGTICGYCNNNFTCQNPQGTFTLGSSYTTYDSGGGNPTGGANISCTVQWECAP